MAERSAAQSSFARFMWYWLPVLAYMALILTLSAQPSLKPPPQLDLTDKFYHALEYFGLGVLLARALRAGRRAAPPMQTMLMALTLGVAMGAADEIFQSFVPGRMFDIYDILADATGVLLAQLGFLLVVRD